MIPLLFALCAALLAASVWLGKRGRRAASTLLWALACACPLALAALGTDFSPSFTMMFLTANLALCALAEFIVRVSAVRSEAYTAQNGGASEAVPRTRAGSVLAGLSGLLFVTGMLFALPSVFIYAAGDDWIDRCVLAAPVAGTLLALVMMLIRRKCGERSRQSAGAMLVVWFSLCAACFALACGLRSTMLLFYGAGLLMMSFARAAGEGGALRSVLFCLGLAVAAVFPVGPLL